MEQIIVNPYEKTIKLAKSQYLYPITEEKEEGVEIEKGIRIANYPLINEERKSFIYNVDDKNLYTFVGIGIISCDKMNDEVIERIKSKIIFL